MDQDKKRDLCSWNFPNLTYLCLKDLFKEKHAAVEGDITHSYLPFFVDNTPSEGKKIVYQFEVIKLS